MIEFKTLHNDGKCAPKVHYAAMGELSALIPAEFVAKKYNRKMYLMFNAVKPEILEDLGDFCQHAITDSGIFQLLYKGTKSNIHKERRIIRPESFYINYQNEYIKYIKSLPVKFVVVECDVQAVAGQEIAWKLRRELYDKLDNRIMSVWHRCDGIEGMQKLLEFTDYLGIAYHTDGSTADDVKAAVKYAYSHKKPNQDIHILGTAEVKLINSLRYKAGSMVTSVDMSNWVRFFKGGITRHYKTKWPMQRNNLARDSEQYAEVLDFVNYKLDIWKRRGIEIRQSRGNIADECIFLLSEYQKNNTQIGLQY